MISIQVRGLAEAQARLSQITRRLESDALWRRSLTPLGEHLQRFAMSISPVDTGSYQASHRFAVSSKALALYVDPAARNTRAGQLVTRYAGPVEEMYNVYGQTSQEAQRVSDEYLRQIVEDA